MDKENTQKIDFVITWVDGSDEKWLEEKSKHVKLKPSNYNNSAMRYRDMNILKYWFRAVEKYANWVNKIYFITYGHLPSWLNINNEKLVIVNHKDFIPAEVLPTFNSNSIEMYMHKINGLSNTFVYFNDDMLINDYVKPTNFFKNGLPTDSLVFDCISSCNASKTEKTMDQITLNNIDLLSKNFDKRTFIKKNFFKVFNFKYGFKNIRTLLLSPWRGFTGFQNPHVGISYLKQTFEEAWNKHHDEFYNATLSKVRSGNDYSHWLFRYWQLASGKFVPKKIKQDKYFSSYDDLNNIVKAIEKRKYKMICINDSNINIDFDKFTDTIVGAYEKVLPNKSSFEN